MAAPRFARGTHRFLAAPNATAVPADHADAWFRRDRVRGAALTWFATTASLAVAYFSCAKFGLTLAIVHASATAVWPPTGIALASLLLLGVDVWPGIFIGAFLANLTTAGSVATSLGVATGNTLEGLVGAYLVNRLANGARPFDRARDTFRFAGLAGMVAPAISASFGVTSLALGGFAPWADFGPIWLTWWLGDMGGALVVAPLLLLWSAGGNPRWDRARWIEAALVLAVLLLVGQEVFGWFAPIGDSGYSFKFLCVPIVAWVAYRFDQRTAATMLFVLAVIAVLGMVHGASHRRELNASLVMLQVFLAVVALTTLALAAVVAERRRVEAAVRQTSERLREAFVELEAYSHAISHDLRSPLGAVLNYAAILEEDWGRTPDPEGLRRLQRLRASAEAATRMLDQLVHFAWVGHGAREKQRVDMTAVAREAYAEVAQGHEGTGGVTFELQELPPAWGDAALLNRVFCNLFSNAVKYSRGRDGRRIEVSGRMGEREVAYCVADNGQGFDPRRGAEMFQPFRRLGDSRQVEGSGLGLAIAARIVRKHEGRIWAESDGANGARFWFTLPHRAGDR